MSEPIFLGYDRVGLDAQFNNRAKVPGFQAYVDRYRSDSARARATLECQLDVGYGPGNTETLNVFPAPQAAVGAPVLVFIHGGYWMAFDKSDNDFVALGLVPNGVAVVNINYALMPGVRMDEAVRQCRSAVAWTLRNATRFGGDHRRVWVCGHSAGGHLMAMVAATDWEVFLGQQQADEALAVPTARPAGGWSLSGLHDLEPIRRCYLNDTLGMDADEAARNTPIGLPAPKSGRWHAAVGSLEGPEYLRQACALPAAWGSTAARRVTAESMLGDDHFSIAARLADPTDPMVAALLQDLSSPA